MYIVTGGAGFIGSAFVKKLNNEGIDHILVVDELDRSDKWKNLRGKIFLDYLDKAEFREKLLADAFGDVTALIHMGACSSTTESDSSYLMENNYRYSREIIEWALKKPKDVRVVYASSGATYGAGEQGYNDSIENLLLLKPMNMYGFSKHLLDLWAKRSGALERIAGLKFFNVYGPNEYHKGDMQSVASKAFRQIASTGKVKLFRSYSPEYGDGEQRRDFVYVKDCCELMWWLLENPGKNGLANCGTGIARSWNDLANAVFSALDKEPNIEFIEMPESLRGQYQYHTKAELKTLGGWGCDVKFHSLEDGVKDYVQNYLATENPYI